MLAAPGARYVSVSELYSTDEVELLLDEIRDLEPTSCRGEDVQDFEIAGSGCEACGGGAGGGGRSPAGTEVTERSWDSHAQYLRSPPPPPRALAPLYCRPRYLLTLQGLCTLIVAACSAGAGGCVWGAAGARLGGGGGAGGAVRALQLGALSSALLHAALLAMRVSALHRLMPLDWDALGALCGAWSACWLAGGAGATLRAVLAPPAAAPPYVRDLFFAAIGLAYSAVLASVALVSAWARARLQAARARRGDRGAYCAVPPAPPDLRPASPCAPSAPSTSRHVPL